MNFDDFDDEPKQKKKKPRKAKKKKAAQVFSRNYYETTIAQLNAKLAELRQRFQRKDEVTQKLNHELTSIEEDRVDVNKYLERTIVKQKVQTTELSERLIVIEAEYKEYKLVSRERIVELQKQYASEHNRLKNEIKLLQTALNSLDEFRLLRDGELASFQSYQDRAAELERQMKEEIFNLEQKAVVQKNVLKKDIEAKLEQVAADFLHSNEIRNASYTRNLIRENITLKQTLDKRVKLNIHTMEEREKQFLKTKEIMEAFTSLEQFAGHLVCTIQNKNDIIDRLKANIERLRMKHIDACRYRSLYDKAMEHGLFEKRRHDFDRVHRRLEELAEEKHDIRVQHRAQEAEIQRLRDVLKKLMAAIRVAIVALQQVGGQGGPSQQPSVQRQHGVADVTREDMIEAYRYTRKNIVAELILIVSNDVAMSKGDDGEVSELSSEQQGNLIYELGKCGFVVPKCYTGGEYVNLLCINSDLGFKSQFTLMTDLRPRMKTISLETLHSMSFSTFSGLNQSLTNQNSVVFSSSRDCSSNYDEEHDEEFKNDAKRVAKIAVRTVRKFYAPIPKDFVNTAKIVACSFKKKDDLDSEEETSSHSELLEEVYENKKKKQRNKFF